MFAETVFVLTIIVPLSRSASARSPPGTPRAGQNQAALVVGEEQALVPVEGSPEDVRQASEMSWSSMSTASRDKCVNDSIKWFNEGISQGTRNIWPMLQIVWKENAHKVWQTVMQELRGPGNYTPLTLIQFAQSTDTYVRCELLNRMDVVTRKTFQAMASAGNHDEMKRINQFRELVGLVSLSRSEANPVSSNMRAGVATDSRERHQGPGTNTPPTHTDYSPYLIASISIGSSFIALGLAIWVTWKCARKRGLNDDAAVPREDGSFGLTKSQPQDATKEESPVHAVLERSSNRTLKVQPMADWKSIRMTKAGGSVLQEKDLEANEGEGTSIGPGQASDSLQPKLQEATEVNVGCRRDNHDYQEMQDGSGVYCKKCSEQRTWRTSKQMQF